jgi:hypothetical protein
MNQFDNKLRQFARADIEIPNHQNLAFVQTGWVEFELEDEAHAIEKGNFTYQSHNGISCVHDAYRINGWILFSLRNAAINFDMMLGYKPGFHFWLFTGKPASDLNRGRFLEFVCHVPLALELGYR